MNVSVYIEQLST